MSEVDVALWRDELDRLCARIGRRFVRAEPRARVRRYVDGLLAGLERKNGWTIAEHAGEVSPDGMQRLLRTADWDVDAVRDDVRDYLVERLGTPQAVLVIDDSGFIKKMTCMRGPLSSAHASVRKGSQFQEREEASPCLS
jgi:SRSO17 transposase